MEPVGKAPKESMVKAPQRENKQIGERRHEVKAVNTGSQLVDILAGA